MQAKAEEDAVRREVNVNTVRTNKQLADERKLAELQEKVGIQDTCLPACVGTMVTGLCMQQIRPQVARLK